MNIVLYSWTVKSIKIMSWNNILWEIIISHSFIIFLCLVYYKSEDIFIISSNIS